MCSLSYSNKRILLLLLLLLEYAGRIRLMLIVKAHLGNGGMQGQGREVKRNS